jgi:hypothetical protein
MAIPGPKPGQDEEKEFTCFIYSDLTRLFPVRDKHVVDHSTRHPTYLVENTLARKNAQIFGESPWNLSNDASMSSGEILQK